MEERIGLLDELFWSTLVSLMELKFCFISKCSNEAAHILA